MKQFKIILIAFGFPLLLFASVGCSAGKELADKKEKTTSEKADVKLQMAFHNGLKEKILGNYGHSSEYFERCLDMEPNHSASLYELASIYEYEGRDTEALAMIKKAVELDKGNKWYKLLLAGLYEKSGRFEEAIAVYETLIREYPNDLEYYYELANAFIHTAEYDKAIDIYDEIEQKTGISEEISIQKEKLYLKDGEEEKAIEEIKKLIKSQPGVARYYGILAELYQDMGNDKKAIETYNKIKEIDPENPYIHLSLADYYRKNGDKERSFEELSLAFENPSLDIDSKVHILLSYYTITETHHELKEQAFKLNEILVIAHPEEAKAWSIYGDFLYRDNRLKEARNAYRKAVEFEQGKYVIWNQLLIIESELNDFEAMLTESEEAMALFPAQPGVYLFNGIAHIQKKNYEEAIQVLNEGKNLVFNNNMLLSQFHANLGEAYYRIENYKESDSSYNQSLELDPENLFVLNNYSYYLSLRGENLEKAAELSKKANELQPGLPSYMDTYGWILYKQEKYEEAKVWIEKAINRGGGNNGVILEHYGDILFRLNDKEGALKYWEKAKEAGNASDKLEQKISEEQLYE